MKTFIIAALILVGLTIVGKVGSNDEMLQQLEYCKNVKLGIWPDYNDSFKTDCSNAQLKEIENKLN